VDLCGALFWIIFALVLITFVGHGIWVLVALFIKACFQVPEAPPHARPIARPRKRTCPRCGEPLPLPPSLCRSCGLDPTSPLAGELRELEALARRVQQFQDDGTLEPAVCEQVYHSIESRQRALIEEPPRSQPKAVPPPAEILPVAKEEPILAEVRAEEPIPSVLPIARAIPAPAEAPPLPIEVKPATLPPPQRSLGEVLGAFMEERNILWGELAGGLLIVGCSIALVISLWRTLEEIPYFPFLILAALTTLIVGAGRYTLTHWKLESTSRGLLVIGTLLVPLNFLVLAGLTRGQEGGLLEIVTDGMAVAGFTWLVLLAGRVLVSPTFTDHTLRPHWLLAFAILGSSVGQLLVPWMIHANPEPITLIGVGLLLVAAHEVTTAVVLRGLARLETMDGRQANTLFTFLGMSTFAVGVALGFALYWSETLRPALRGLPLPIALAGIPVLAAGALVHRKLQQASPAADVPPDTASRGLSPAVARLVGSATALSGALVLLVAQGLAWPDAGLLMVLGMLNVLALSVVALRYGLPPAHVPALVCLGIGFLAVGALGEGAPFFASDVSGQMLLGRMLSPASGWVLLGFVLALTVFSEALARRRRRLDAVIHAGGAGVGALLSLTLVGQQVWEAPARTALACGIYGITMLVANTRWRRALLTYAAALLFQGGVLAGLHAVAPDLAPERLLLLGLLFHATGMLAACLLLERRAPAFPMRDPTFVQPMRRSALAASVLVAFLLGFVVSWEWMLPAACCAAWLAGLWLVMAWRGRSAVGFTAFQVALSVAVILGASAWLQQQAWFEVAGRPIEHPRSLHVYGLALAALNLAWLTARHLLRTNLRAQVLWQAAWPIVEGVILGGVVVAQLGLTICAISPGVASELTPAAGGLVAPAYPPVLETAFEPSARILLLVLGIALLGARRFDRSGLPEIGLLLLAITVPCLSAGAFREDQAVASALRWGLSLCFVAVSVVLWLRDRAAMPGIEANRVSDLAAILRRVLLLFAVVPVLALTVFGACLGFAGERTLGPLGGSFFQEMGWFSHIGPLALVSLGLAGHALRERSSGYAFAAGLVANVSLVGGYALAVVTGGGRLGEPEWVRMLQLGCSAAAFWALAWMIVRKRLRLCLGVAAPQPHDALLQTQLGLSVALLVFLLVPALAFLTLRGPSAASVALYPSAHPWTATAGTSLSWLALVLVAVAVRKNIRLAVGVPGWIFGDWPGLAAMTLLAFTVEALAPGWGYRALMLGWASWLTSAALTRYLVRIVPAQAVGLLGLISAGAALLALGAAGAYQDHLWGAATFLLLSLALAIVARVRRQEGWALASASSLIAMTGLIVWHIHRDLPLSAWWGPLGQAALITVGAAGAAWLGARRQIYQGADLSLASSPLLAGFLGLSLCVDVVILGGALVPLLLAPPGLGSDWLTQAGALAAWPAVLLPLAVTLAYLRRVKPGACVHVVGLGGLVLGALAACCAAVSNPQSAWFPLHVLTLAWTFLALAILGATWAGATLPQIGPLFLTAERRTRTADLLAQTFPKTTSRRWVEAITFLVVALALRGAWEDPGRPYWSSGAVLAVAVLLGLMALWTRQAAYVVGSGLMLNVVGFLAWIAWKPETPATLVSAQIICLAVGASLWSLLQRALRYAVRPTDIRALTSPYCNAAALGAVHVLGVLVLCGVASDLVQARLHVGGLDTWVALLATTAALLLLVADPESSRMAMSLPALYAAGYLALGLSLHSAALTPSRLFWSAGLLLGSYLLLATVLSRLVGRVPLLKTLVQPAENAKDIAPAWFLAGQSLGIALAVGLGCWMSLSFAGIGERLAGGLGLLLAMAAVGLMEQLHFKGAFVQGLPVRPVLRQVTLALMTVAVITLSWALLDPTLPVPWLQRSVLAMGCLFALSVAYGTGPLRRLIADSDWVESAHRQAPVLVGLTGLLLAGVLAQEFAFYDPVARRTPLILPLVLLMVATLGGMIVASLLFAVRPGQDLFAVPAHRRTLYVYGAEVLLLLLFLHLRWNVPDLFPGFLGQHWTLVIMALAFAGVGLSEWFQRRGLGVLAGPLQRTGLFLPLLPLLAFLVRPLADLRAGLDQSLPAVQPLLRYLDRLPGNYGSHALVWFLLGLLYTLVAITRRSTTFALLAALAANFGLWVIFANHEQVTFLLHPQLWLIPPALILLVAEALNRHRLEPALSLGLRYLALLLIYLSSTADMFIAGLGNSVVLPIILAVLSIVGMLAGIVLRVRAFLFLGVTFLFLVIFAQIWHAAVDRAQTWVWWASGIVLGAAVLALFALFEKRRNDVLKLIGELKEWK
jgi:hypothetical protein